MALFLAVGMAGRMLIVAVSFLVDPAWLHHSVTLHRPAPRPRSPGGRGWVR